MVCGQSFDESSLSLLAIRVVSSDRVSAPTLDVLGKSRRRAEQVVNDHVVGAADDFQRDRTRADRRRSSIDWTIEQEWRHLGDLNLQDLPPDAGLVFVPTVEEAERLITISPWPVVVVPPTHVSQ